MDKLGVKPNKPDFYRAYSLGLRAYCLKHQGEKPLYNLQLEFKAAISPYILRRF